MYLHGNLHFSEALFLESVQKGPRNAHNLCGAAIVLMERGTIVSATTCSPDKPVAAVLCALECDIHFFLLLCGCRSKG